MSNWSLNIQVFLDNEMSSCIFFVFICTTNQVNFKFYILLTVFKRKVGSELFPFLYFSAKKIHGLFFFKLVKKLIQLFLDTKEVKMWMTEVWTVNIRQEPILQGQGGALMIRGQRLIVVRTAWTIKQKKIYLICQTVVSLFTT